MARKASWPLSKTYLSIMMCHGETFMLKARRPPQPFVGSQILLIICVTRHKYLYHEISKNALNNQVHSGQQWAQHFRTVPPHAQHGGIMQNLPYSVVGKSPKRTVPDLRKTNRTIPRHWINFVTGCQNCQSLTDLSNFDRYVIDRWLL